MKTTLFTIVLLAFAGMAWGGQEFFKPKKENLKIFLTAFRI